VYLSSNRWIVVLPLASLGGTAINMSGTLHCLVARSDFTLLAFSSPCAFTATSKVGWWVTPSCAHAVALPNPARHPHACHSDVQDSAGALTSRSVVLHKLIVGVGGDWTKNGKLTAHARCGKEEEEECYRFWNLPHARRRK
jgi:hypothetical protein